jgi:hypothetical protein
MPNYIKNRLTVNGTEQEVKEILDKYSTFFPRAINRAADGSAICRKKTDERSFGWYDERTKQFSYYSREDGELKYLFEMPDICQ